jgi:hypothetical protein
MKHMSTFLKTAILSVAVLAPILSTQMVSAAGVNDFVINRFDADYVLTRDDPQGKLIVTELIDVTFSGENHGILRALPNTYKNHRLQLHIDDIIAPSAPGKWSTYQSNGNTVIKIGDPGKTVTGRQNYVIQYTVNNVISFYDNHDELFWDVNGDQWGQQAKIITSILHLPEGLKLSNNKPICYTGNYGSTKRECTIVYSQAKHTVITKVTQPLQANQTLSIVVGFEKEYFTTSTWPETISEYSGIIIGFTLPFLLIAGTGGYYWYKRGRDAKGRDVIVAQFDAPYKLRPLEVGTLMDFRADTQDITATIIDLAVRGYVKIIETTQKRKILKDLTTYSLQLRNDNFEALADFEAQILRGIFDDKPNGTEIDLNDLKFKLSTVAAKVGKETKQSLKDQGYFSKISPDSGRRFVLMLIFAYLVGILLALIYKMPAIVGIAAATVLVVIFIALLPSRTTKGTEAKEHALGLKMYLDVAEKDRLKMLQSPNARYAAKTTEPKRTVDLFEKLLPYAMVLGVEKQWAAKFKDIYKSPPDWYGGNLHTFNAVYLATALDNGINTAVTTVFSSPNSSSGSGFSGGGAGGGGGGGGGGGW